MDNQSVSFKVAKDDFASSVSWVARSLPSKPVQPVLRGMVITADDNGLELAGYDYEVSTKVRIPAEVITPGRIAVAGKLISDITATLPNREVSVVFDGSVVVMKCGSSRFEIPSIPIDDYPALPALPEETGTVNPHAFAGAVSQVAIAAGRDETLPMLTGICLEVNGAEMLLASTDRFRLAVRKIEWEPNDSSVEDKILVPAKTLLDNAKTLESFSTEDISLAFGEGQDNSASRLLGVKSDQRQTTTRLLNAQFPNFRPLLPKEHSSIATINIEDLNNALKRVSLVANKSGQVRLEFSEGQVVLSAEGVEAGHAEEVVSCAFVGEPLMTAFNPQYLRDGLSAMKSNRVVFGFTESSRPVLLIPEPSELPEAREDGMFPTPDTDFSYVLMPVRIPS